MTILMTGGRGFVGNHLLSRLRRDGHHVRLIGRCNLDIHLVGLHGIDAIIHCAGEINNPDEMFVSNVCLTERLLRFARDAKIPKFIHVASSAEYKMTGQPCREDALCEPVNLYEATKLAATALCQGFAGQYDMGITVARPFSLYGPNDTPRKLIPTLYRSFLDHSFINLHESDHDWLYIDDFVDGLILLLSQPREVTKGQIFNFGTGVASTNLQVVDALEEALGGQLFIRNQPTKYHAYDTINWVADNTKVRTLGWSPKYDLKSGIKAYVMAEWFNADKG